MLETLNTTNIGALSLPEPQVRSELSFDINREIADQDWYLIIKDMRVRFRNEYQGGSKSELSLWQAAALSLVLPEKHSTAFSSLPFDAVLQRSAEGASREFYETRAAVRLLQPDFIESPFNFYSGDLVKIKLLSEARYLGYGDSFLRLASSMNVLNPAGYLDLTEEDFKKVTHRYNTLNEDCAYIFKLNLLFPELAKDFNKKVNVKGIQQKIREGLILLRQGKNYPCLEGYLLDLKTLFSDGVRVINGKIEFIPRELQTDFTNNIPALPEMRKF
ncbi:MAG: hypothetical protein Q7R49_01785 [Candidatus Daviesbacteria bacterium]|nr:hypothetical protein [Candidatus Daviesbacteria bacterium]